MRRKHIWLEALVVAILFVLNGSRWFDPSHKTTQAASPLRVVGWTPQRKLAAREKTRKLWYHGFHSYMDNAFPLDELSPLSCSGKGPDWRNPTNVATNDVAGNFSLTLIDVLDTFIVLDDRPGFEKAVKNIIDRVSFDVNTKPQVFETTIRVLGGLLSGHIFANRSNHSFHLPWYRGELLDLAHDLGQRLLPAFNTPTGLPFARINLRHGIMKGETIETCAAGAGSLILEFATLSRLTGDDRFEKAAYKAFFGIWNRKSDIGLVGNTINIYTGNWLAPEISGIGAGIDSFYEYALKWYIMSGESEFLDVWDDAYAAVMRYSRDEDGFWSRNVNMKDGSLAFFTVDSLSAFWPGIQVLAGDIQSAIKLHMLYYNLWIEHAGLPEVFDTNYRRATSHQYPLRPEFIESTWYLYRATRDPFYLEVGERILFDITTRAKVPCGLAGIQDLRDNKQDDRMESFVLSETLKYLYLLFDEGNFIHQDSSNYVFTTEGHILTLETKYLKPSSSIQRKYRTVENHQCPAYTPLMLAPQGPTHSGLAMSVMHGPDVDYSRELVGRLPSSADANIWSPNGWCARPNIELYSYEFILSRDGKVVPEDVSPSVSKLVKVTNGYMIHNITGIRTRIVQRLDGNGYNIRKRLYSVRGGEIVYINDSSIFLSSPENKRSHAYSRDDEVQLQFYLQLRGTLANSNGIVEDFGAEEYVTAFTGDLGADISYDPTGQTIPPRFGRGAGVQIFRDSENPVGCNPYKKLYMDGVLLVRRGHCTFLEKLVHAKAALAAGVAVISNHDMALRPTADPEELLMAGDLSDVGIVVLPKTSGELIYKMLEIAQEQEAGQVMMFLHPEQQSTLGSPSKGHELEMSDEPVVDSTPRILYVNGHPLLNTRLLV